MACSHPCSMTLIRSDFVWVRTEIIACQGSGMSWLRRLMRSNCNQMSAIQNSKVPQFSSWTADENVGYTAYFETARKGKSGGMIVNPNDIQMNRDVPPPARPTPTPRPTKPESK